MIEYDLKFNENELQLIVNVLAELPHRQVKDLLYKIEQQAINCERLAREASEAILRQKYKETVEVIVPAKSIVSPTKKIIKSSTKKIVKT